MRELFVIGSLLLILTGLYFFFTRRDVDEKADGFMLFAIGAFIQFLLHK